MAPKKSLLDQMRSNPRADWDINSVRTLCDQHGITLLPPSNGSHYKAKSPHLNGLLTIPAKRPIKAPYIRSLVSMIDAHIECARATERKE
jgi:hypothetical protein